METKKEENRFSNRIIMGIDPGPLKTGYVLYEPELFKIIDKGHISNRDMLEVINTTSLFCDFMALETVKSFGNIAGDTLFYTCMWIGRFISAWIAVKGENGYTLIPRKTVAAYLCGTARAGNSQVRTALISFFSDRGVKGAGVTPIIGTKKKPGALYGVTDHAWSALALAVFWSDITEKDRIDYTSTLE